MLTQQTLTQLRDLKLRAMAEGYERQLSQPTTHNIGFDERLALLVEAEVSARDTRRLQRLIKAAKLPDFPLIEDTDYRPGRGLDKSLIASLATGEWVRRKQSVLLMGATGTGKSWLGCVLVAQMCWMGRSALYLGAGDLFDSLTRAHSDGTWSKFKRLLIQVDVLMLDDWGVAPIPPEWGHVFLDLVDKRSRTGSLVITSQYPLNKWHSIFPDPTLADASLDRIVHNAHQILLKGESMRKLRAREAKSGN
jgi:DNA replication protein DnaC